MLDQLQEGILRWIRSPKSLWKRAALLWVIVPAPVITLLIMVDRNAARPAETFGDSLGRAILLGLIAFVVLAIWAFFAPIIATRGRCATRAARAKEGALANLVGAGVFAILMLYWSDEVSGRELFETAITAAILFVPAGAIAGTIAGPSPPRVAPDGPMAPPPPAPTYRKAS